MFISFAYNISAVVSDIKIRIKELNDELKGIDRERLGQHIEVKKELVKILRFHAEAKE